MVVQYRKNSDVSRSCTLVPLFRHKSLCSAPWYGHILISDTRDPRRILIPFVMTVVTSVVVVVVAAVVMVVVVTMVGKEVMVSVVVLTATSKTTATAVPVPHFKFCLANSQRLLCVARPAIPHCCKTYAFLKMV